MILITAKKCRDVHNGNKAKNTQKYQNEIEMKRIRNNSNSKSKSKSKNNSNPFNDEAMDFTPQKLHIPLKKPSDDIPYNLSTITKPESPPPPASIKVHGKLRDLEDDNDSDHRKHHSDNGYVIKVESPIDDDEDGLDNEHADDTENERDLTEENATTITLDEEDETELMTQTESSMISPSISQTHQSHDSQNKEKLQNMMAARKYLMSESNEERYIQNMMNNAVVISKPHHHQYHAHQYQHQQIPRRRLNNFSPNFIHGNHKKLVTINDNNDETETEETETMTTTTDPNYQQYPQHLQHRLYGHQGMIPEMEESSIVDTEEDTKDDELQSDQYTIENVQIFDVDPDVDSLPVLPATVTSATTINEDDGESITWISKDGYQFNDKNILLSSNDTGNELLLISDQNNNGDTSNNNMGDGYQWIKCALMEIDGDDWRLYVSNFRKNKVTENRLRDLKGSDLKELIPKIGPRNEFEKLLRQRLEEQRYKD